MTERHLPRRSPTATSSGRRLSSSFFDLVFVFAITQLSHLLVEHLDLEGVAQTAFLLLVVWWAWIYTTWMTNWFDPDAIAVRAVLILVALASLLMAIAIPDAFGERAVMFAASYAGLQIVRNAFAAFASPPGSVHRENFVRILLLVGRRRRTVGGRERSYPTRPASLCGSLRSSPTTEGPMRATGCRALGRVGTEAWQIQASHFAERFQLFVIIALGESIVITGLTASELDLTRRPSVRSRSRFSARRLSGGSTSTTWRGSLSCASPCRTIQVGWPGMRTPTSTSRSSPDDRHRGGRRARDRPPDRASRRGRAGGGGRRTGALPDRPRRLPLCA